MGERYAGVDVGGARKGFDIAIVSASGSLVYSMRLPTVEAVRRTLEKHEAMAVAIDSPRGAAPDGERSREGERRLVRAVGCNIRWTPDEATLLTHEYYAWIVRGRELYDDLAANAPPRCRVIECFPTASWTRWAGPRGKARRSTWTRAALGQLGLTEVPKRTNQDLRDAIAAAITAYQSQKGETDRYGDIEVPSLRPRFQEALLPMTLGGRS